MAPSVIFPPAEDSSVSKSSVKQKQQQHQPLKHADNPIFPTGRSLRLASRAGTFTTVTAGQAPTYLQANLIILPSRYAADFRLLCQRNPVPCPLLAESVSPGRWDKLKTWIPGLDMIDEETIITNATSPEEEPQLDLRRDAPKYNIYHNGLLSHHFQTPNILPEWTSDHIAFLIGCSYSFESAMTRAGLTPRHISTGRNVPMYRTNIPLCAAGVFTGATYVVSMRPLRRGEEVEKARDITRPYVATHGEPIAWGWEAVRRLGIGDIAAPEWGDPPVRRDGRVMDGEEEEDGEVPVFWGCGVTPQEAVVRAKLEGTVMAHAPGHMLVLDLREEQLLGAC